MLFRSSCGAAQGGSCSATVNVYSASTSTTCQSLVATLHPTESAGDCANLAGNPTVASRSATFSAVSGGACAAGGGDPVGEVTPTGATTFCCVP